MKKSLTGQKYFFLTTVDSDFYDLNEGDTFQFPAYSNLNNITQISWSKCFSQYDSLT